MKILLIQPPVAEKNITSFMYPPMGLISLAAVARENGHEVKIHDCNLYSQSYDEAIKLIKLWKPEIVGITAMTVNIGHGLEMAKKVKQISRKIITIVGGVHATVAPRDVLKDKNVDYLVIGEGEVVFVKLLESLEKHKSVNRIKGVGYKTKSKLFINKKEDLIKDISKLPISAYDLLDFNKYRAPYTSRHPFMSMIRSRGCPYLCTFCGVQSVFAHKYRTQKPDRTIEEIKYLIKNFGVKELSFKDSEFTLDQNNVEKLCDLLIKAKYDLTWNCNGRVNNVSLKVLIKMKQAGCQSITYGVESGDEQILKNLKKAITLDQVRQAIKLTKKAGLKAVTNFMIGNPGDTPETIEKTIKFAIELDTDYTYFGFTTPFPGTELREQAVKNKWLIRKELDAVKYEDLTMNATSLGNEELKECLNRAYRSFYFRPKYILRRLTKLSRDEIQNSINGLASIISDLYKTKKFKGKIK